MPHLQCNNRQPTNMNATKSQKIDKSPVQDTSQFTNILEVRIVPQVDAKRNVQQRLLMRHPLVPGRKGVISYIVYGK